MFLLSNTAISLDGRTGLRDQPRHRVGSRADLHRMRQLRATVDAVLVGGATFRAWPLGLAAEPPRPLTMAVLTRRGVLPAAVRWSPRAEVALLVLGGSDVDAAAHAQAFGAEVRTSAMSSLAWALEELGARGCQRVLLEGGGQLVREALAEGLLDELHLTVCPVVLGGDQPGLVEGAVLPVGAGVLELVSSEACGDELVVCYRRRCARAGSGEDGLGARGQSGDGP